VLMFCISFDIKQSHWINCSKKVWKQSKVQEVPNVDHFEVIFHYICHLIDLPFCSDRQNRKFTCCSCLCSPSSEVTILVSNSLGKFFFYHVFYVFYFNITLFHIAASFAVQPTEICHTFLKEHFWCVMSYKFICAHRRTFNHLCSYKISANFDTPVCVNAIENLYGLFARQCERGIQLWSYSTW